jgi:hypothetical protein
MVCIFFCIFRNINIIFSKFSTLQIFINLCWIWHQPRVDTLLVVTIYMHLSTYLVTRPIFHKVVGLYRIGHQSGFRSQLSWGGWGSSTTFSHIRLPIDTLNPNGSFGHLKFHLGMKLGLSKYRWETTNSNPLGAIKLSTQLEIYDLTVFIRLFQGSSSRGSEICGIWKFSGLLGLEWWWWWWISSKISSAGPHTEHWWRCS